MQAVSSKKKNIAIGAFILLACIFFAVLLLILRPSYGDGKQLIRIRFNDVSKIYPGTVVTFAGRSVGRVLDIRDITKEEVNGDLYFYEIHIELDSKIVIYKSYQFTLTTAGLLGEKTIAIIPYPPMKHRIDHEEVIYAKYDDKFSQTFDQVLHLSTKMEATLDNISSLIQSNQEEASLMIRSIRILSDHLNQMLLEIKEKKITSNLSSILEQTEQAVQCLHKENFFENMTLFSKKSIMILDHLNTILGTVNEKRGSLGKLIYHEGIYMRTLSTVNKTEQLLDAIHRYGLLFHHSKEWKRLQKKKVHEVEKLQNSQQLSEFMDKELNDMLHALNLMKFAVDTFEENSQEKFHSKEDSQQSLQNISSRLEELQQVLNEHIASK